MSKKLLDQDWCPEHYDYFYKDEGCQTCKNEEEVSE
jgi:hypothetical protein